MTKYPKGGRQITILHKGRNYNMNGDPIIPDETVQVPRAVWDEVLGALQRIHDDTEYSIARQSVLQRLVGRLHKNARAALAKAKEVAT